MGDRATPAFEYCFAPSLELNGAAVPRHDPAARAGDHVSAGAGPGIEVGLELERVGDLGDRVEALDHLDGLHQPPL